jgi:thioesterase III
MFTTTVQSTHLDQFGHVNNARYFEYFEWARWDWAKSIGADFVSFNLTPVTVHMEIDFIKELGFLENIIINTKLEKIKGKSFVLRQEMLGRDSAKAAILLVTLVFIDKTLRKSVEIPSGFRDKLYLI